MSLNAPARGGLKNAPSQELEDHATTTGWLEKLKQHHVHCDGWLVSSRFHVFVISFKDCSEGEE